MEATLLDGGTNPEPAFLSSGVLGLIPHRMILPPKKPEAEAWSYELPFVIYSLRNVLALNTIADVDLVNLGKLRMGTKSNN